MYSGMALYYQWMMSQDILVQCSHYLECLWKEYDMFG